jgi:hypothetical protein
LTKSDESPERATSVRLGYGLMARRVGRVAYAPTLC